MQEGVVTTMASPGPVDRLAALRSMVTREGLIVENADLQHLAEGHPRGGRWKTPFALTFTPPIRVTLNPVHRSRITSRPPRRSSSVRSMRSMPAASLAASS